MVPCNPIQSNSFARQNGEDVRNETEDQSLHVGQKNSKWTTWHPSSKKCLHKTSNLCNLEFWHRKKPGYDAFFSACFFVKMDHRRFPDELNMVICAFLFVIEAGKYIYWGSASEITLRHLNDAVWLLNSHFKRKLKSKKRKLSLGIHFYMTEDEKKSLRPVLFFRCIKCVVKAVFLHWKTLFVEIMSCIHKMLWLNDKYAW